MSQKDAHTSLEELKGKKLDGNYIRMSYKKWWTIAPHESEAHVQIKNGKEWYWCMKCNKGQGLWTDHLERDHGEDDCQPQNKRPRSSNNGSTEQKGNTSQIDMPLKWKTLPPRLADSYTKDVDGKTYKWCENRKTGEGRWVQQSEEEYRGIKRPRLEDNRRTTELDHPRDRRDNSSIFTKNEEIQQSGEKRGSYSLTNKSRYRYMFRHLHDTTRYYRVGEVKTAMSGKLPPSIWNSSIPVCLSFHIRGNCSSGCRSVEDHKPMNKHETERLADWFERHGRKETSSDQRLFSKSHRTYVDSQDEDGEDLKCWELKLPKTRFVDAKPSIVGPGGRNNNSLRKRTGCEKIALVPWGKSGCKVKIADVDSTRAKSSCYHVLKILRQELGRPLNDARVQYLNP
eukprot:483594_1